MNRNLLVLVIVLLVAIVSTTNAMPLINKLDKRTYTKYLQCPLKPHPPPTLYVSTDPDPLYPGEVATFYVNGELAEPATTGSELFIAFLDKNEYLVGDLFALDICSTYNCPLKKFDGYGPVSIPYDLPDEYYVVVFIVDYTGKYVLACAIAYVGGSGGSGGTSYIVTDDSGTISNKTFITTGAAGSTDANWH
jgi:hypothetical protein